MNRKGPYNYCEVCGARIKRPAALIFSPPREGKPSKRYFVDRACWPLVRSVLKSKRENR